MCEKLQQIAEAWMRKQARIDGQVYELRIPLGGGQVAVFKFLNGKEVK